MPHLVMAPAKRAAETPEGHGISIDSIELIEVFQASRGPRWHFPGPRAKACPLHVK